MSLFRRRLVCFYCGQKSNFKWDSSISQFECQVCDATNYLDSAGNITDPPLETVESTTNNQVLYASRKGSNLINKSPVFCEKCLRNQQYQYDIMKQMDIELDSRHPEYQRWEEKVRNAKKDLDKRYPLVCAECAPKAQEKRDQADKFAKSDWLGRLNALSELIRRQKTWKDTFQNVIYQTLLYPVASKVWYLGIIGQMTALPLALFDATQILDKVSKFVPYLPNDSALHIISLLASIRCLGLTILCNFISCGMNPFFSRWHPRGNSKRVIGFFNWYGYQLLLQLSLRIILQPLFESGVFSHLSPFSTMAINTCAISSNLFIAYASRFYLGPKKIALWKSTPGPVYAPPKFEASERSGNALGDILDEIMASASQTHHQTPPSLTSHAQRSSPINQEPQAQPVDQRHTSNLGEKNFANSFQRRSEVSRQTEVLPKTDVSGLNRAEFNRYLTTGEVPDWKAQEGEEMDWDPTITHVKHDFIIRHRALDTAPNNETPVQSFGQSSSPFNAPSPFYGKLPAAPISPAHRLRNPPNRPRLQVASAQRKENFFNSMTQKPALSGDTNNERHEVHFAPPRFHAPNPTGYRLDDDFENAFSKFSLKEEPEHPNNGEKKLSICKAFGMSLLIGGLAIGAGAYYKSQAASQDEFSSSLEAMTMENTLTM